MGEALMFKRGGSVKHDMVLEGSSSHIISPDLVNIRNAVIYMDSAGMYTTADGSYSAIVTIFIENGVISGWITTDGKTSDSHSGDTMNYDPATGTISYSGDAEFFVDNRNDHIPVYSYIIFD